MSKIMQFISRLFSFLKTKEPQAEASVDSAARAFADRPNSARIVIVSVLVVCLLIGLWVLFK